MTLGVSREGPPEGMNNCTAIRNMTAAATVAAKIIHRLRFISLRADRMFSLRGLAHQTLRGLRSRRHPERSEESALRLACLRLRRAALRSDAMRHRPYPLLLGGGGGGQGWGGLIFSIRFSPGVGFGGGKGGFGGGGVSFPLHSIRRPPVPATWAGPWMRGPLSSTSLVVSGRKRIGPRLFSPGQP
jgi:hypothetical protein